MITLSSLNREEVRSIRSWPRYPSEFSELDYALRPGGWPDEYAAKAGAHLYAARFEGELVGFSILSDDAGGTEFRIALHPEKLGAGLGGAIVRATLREAFDVRNKPSVYLIVRISNLRARRLYERIGFVAGAQVVKPVNGADVRFIRMELSAASHRLRVVPFEGTDSPDVLDIAHYRVLYIKEGKGVLSDGFREIPLQDDTFYFFSPGESLKPEGEGEGMAVSFSPEFLSKEQNTLKQLFSPCHRVPYLRVSETMRSSIDALSELIRTEYSRDIRDHDILRAHLHALLLYVLRMRSGIVRKQNTWRQERMAQIETLIEAHFRREHYAPFYAKQLNLTTQYLNTLLKRNLGKTLTRLLAERIILEAKRELLHTPRSITTIADALGFADPSYFARYFKKETGLSPLAFRESFKKYR